MARDSSRSRSLASRSTPATPPGCWRPVALVLLMAPGLALFYGGMVRSKSVLNMMMMTFGALAVVAILWVAGRLLAGLRRRPRRRPGRRPAQYAGLGELLEPDANGESRAADPVRGLPGALLRHHRRAGLRERSPTGPASAPGWSSSAVWTLLVYAPIAHWIFDFSAGDHVGGWMANELGHRLRRRHRGRDLLRGLGAGAGARARAAGRVRQGPDAPAQPDAGHARRRPAVVRLVRLQRRLGARRQPDGRGRLHHHPAGRRRRLAGLAGCSSASATATPPRSVPRPAWSPAWWRSRRRAARCRRSARS